MAALHELEDGVAAPLRAALAAAALPYVPGLGWGTSGWLARSTTGSSNLRMRICLHVIQAAMSLSFATLGSMPPMRTRNSPYSWPWDPQTIPMAHSAPPTSQLKAKGRREVRARLTSCSFFCSWASAPRLLATH